MTDDLRSLPKLRDSISYLYVEHCVIERDGHSIMLIRKNEQIPIPVASLTVLMIGPGTKITHAAVKTMSDSGCSAIWCGEEMQRFYSFGSPETKSAKNVLHQAKLCMDDNSHLEVVRRMYKVRFSELIDSNLTIQQLRGMEGARVREAYKNASRATGVEWSSRNYKTTDWNDADDINKALSQANSILYSICHAAIVSLGFSTALGFIHTGKMLSFVYDVADLYKTETTIPAAFEAVKIYGESGDNLSSAVRKLVRERVVKANIMKRIPKDLAYILDVNSVYLDDPEIKQELWDEGGNVLGGANYGKEENDSNCS